MALMILVLTFWYISAIGQAEAGQKSSARAITVEMLMPTLPETRTPIDLTVARGIRSQAFENQLRF